MKFADFRIFNRIRRALSDDDGAVTVDWVVLTAAIVSIGLITISVIRGGVYELASDIYTSITANV